MSVTPTVAIVGRPNVGKSKLFNRLLGRRRAIVHDQPGVTRDRLVAVADLGDGVTAQLVDTGGLVPGDDPLGLGEQVLLAAEESDLLLLVVDGAIGLTTADERVAEALASRRRPTLVVVNKADVRGTRESAVEFHRLGLGTPFVVSSEHAQGIGELLEEVRRRLPAVTTEPVAEETVGVPPVAIVGRPNVGKSSLVNRLLGVSRLLVSPTPGTTRDPIDTLLERGGKRYLLVDTAGIRRRSRVSGTPEDLAVMMARRQIERSDVAVLVVDAEAGVTSGDLAVAGAIWESARAAVVAVNKWDLLDDVSRQRLDLTWPRLAELLAEPRRVNLSAATGRGVDKLFPLLDETLASFRLDVQTAELNRLLERAVAAHSPPQLDGKPWRLYYATQVSSGPPTFMLFANRTLALRDTYRRFLENRLRETLSLAGVPIRLVIRQREGR